jgi:dTDP-4-amino-4,6-dideoxygalactose transaminase
MVDLKAQYQRVRTEIDDAVAQVIESGQFVGGEQVERFEEEFARACGVAHACGVANGTDALALALKALGVGPQDEVVTVACTFFGTAEAILTNGARPVFVDVEPLTATLDPALLERAITARTRAIVPVHLYGHPADMDAISQVAERHGLPVLEDAAQAHGALVGSRRVGSLGHAACFSFYPSKNLGAYGDGGAVVSDDADFVARVRRLAAHGAGSDRYDHLVAGTNSRLDALQAAVLRVKLRHLDRWIAERRERACAYEEALAGLPRLTLPRERPGARSAWYLYTVRLAARDELRAHLASRGVASAVHYPKPLHLQPALAFLAGQAGELPVSEELSRQVLSLPLYPELPLETLARIAAEVHAFCAASAA